MSTGIVRRIDELGRIVVPKEIRKSLRIKSGDNLEIILDNDEIKLKKYSEIETLEHMANIYTEAFYNVLKYNIIVTDRDRIVSISGPLKKKYEDKELSEDIIRNIERRDNFVERKKKDLKITDDLSEFCYYAFSTIISNGDSIGSVIILSTDVPLMEQEEKLSMILSQVLSNYFI